MAHALDQLLDQYDKGHLNRRELLKGMTLAIGGALAGTAGTAVEAQGPAMLPAVNLNHVNIMAKDVKKSAEFYKTVFGAKPQLEVPGVAIMSFPGATAKSGCWISIGEVTKRPEMDDANGTAGVTHLAIGVDVNPADFPRLGAEVQKRFPDLKTPRTPKMANNHPVGPYELYVFDPDGVSIQLLRPEFDAAAMAVMRKG